MRKLIATLLSLLSLSYSSNATVLLLSKNKFAFVYETNVLDKPTPHKKNKKKKVKINDAPWLISGGMILAGAATAVVFGYNQKNKPALAIAGGSIAILGGALATVRVFSMSKKGAKMFGMATPLPSTSIAINPKGLQLQYQF